VESAARSAAAAPADVLRLEGRVTGILLNIYAMRMAAVFTISTVTIGLRTKIIPRWLGYVGYAFALVLLVSLGISRWVQLLFPLWILMVSVDILVRNLRAQAVPAAGA
jgi:hypothetical protein